MQAIIGIDDGKMAITIPEENARASETIGKVKNLLRRTNIPHTSFTYFGNPGESPCAVFLLG